MPETRETEAEKYLTTLARIIIEEDLKSHPITPGNSERPNRAALAPSTRAAESRASRSISETVVHKVAALVRGLETLLTDPRPSPPHVNDSPTPARESNLSLHKIIENSHPDVRAAIGKKISEMINNRAEYKAAWHAGRLPFAGDLARDAEKKNERPANAAGMQSLDTLWASLDATAPTPSPSSPTTSPHSPTTPTPPGPLSDVSALAARLEQTEQQVQRLIALSSLSAPSMDGNGSPLPSNLAQMAHLRSTSESSSHASSSSVDSGQPHTSRPASPSARSRGARGGM